MPEAVVGPNMIHSWSGSVVMDPGVASFQEHILELARRHIERLPDAAGIGIDQMLWLAHVDFAPGADDGVGWYGGGRPGRMLGLGWIDLLGKLGPLMHRAGKVIFVNTVSTTALTVCARRTASTTSTATGATRSTARASWPCASRP